MRFFRENSLIMACYAFGNLETRTVTPNRLKNQSSGALKLLGQNCNHQQGFIKKKLSLSIIVVLRHNFLNTFIKIPILGKLYECSSCYEKLEQHWIECICDLSNLIIQCLVHKKVSALHFSTVSQKFPNCDLLHFR